MPSQPLTPAPRPFEAALKGKRILVTGHSGFTGGWVCTWLEAIGAKPFGLSLPPDTTPSLCEALRLDERMQAVYGDIRETANVTDAFARFRPDAVLHLAAQPLVRRSYAEPVETFATNVMGTAHVLEAARRCNSVKAIVCITTDKVYRNREWAWPYREDDALGGLDPYSASKSACEMVIDSYRYAFGTGRGGPAIATARGGNIVGGGDWSEDRLVPDFVRAVVDRKPITLRYPQATRPWQHVLALCEGYLQLLAGLIEDPARFERAWNFGPLDTTEYSVGALFDMLAETWERPEIICEQNPLPEAGALALDSSLARRQLGWTQVWDTPEMIRRTAQWYKDYYANRSSARRITLDQLQVWRAMSARES